MTAAQLPLGTFGAWRRRYDVTPALAARIEGLGYTALWVGGSPGPDLRDVEALLDGTETLVVATGIVNIWRSAAVDIAAAFHRIEASHPGRLLLGIGSGHSEADAARTRPYASLVSYLDVLDAEGVPAGRRALAALGPRTLELAAARSLGSHPYLTPPAHTRWARGVLGPDALLAPDQMVIGETAPAAARPIGAEMLGRYRGMSNYTGMLRGYGLEFDDDGSAPDRLIDELTVWGPSAALAAAARAHLDAGANHVAVHVLPAEEDPLRVLGELAPALFEG